MLEVISLNAFFRRRFGVTNDDLKYLKFIQVEDNPLLENDDHLVTSKLVRDYIGSTALTASQISVVATGNLTSTNVQDALEELQSDIDALTAGGATQLNELSDVVSAANTSGFTLVANGTTGYVGRALLTSDISNFGSYADASHTHPTSDIVSGTFADARIAQSNITQHQTALSITESQISDLQSYLTTVNLGYAPSTRTITNTGGNNVTLPEFTSTDAGLVPSSGGGTTDYLRADGMWSSIATLSNIADGTGNELLIGSASQSGDINLVATSSDTNANIRLVAKGTGNIISIDNFLPDDDNTTIGSTSNSFIAGYFDNIVLGDNSSIGASRTISVRGSDPDVDISISAKGTGSIDMNNFPIINGSSYNGVSLTTGGSASNFLNEQGNYVSISGGASQLSDLSDVNTSTPTNRNVLVADGTDWESRPLVESDISDLGSYVQATKSTFTPSLVFNTSTDVTHTSQQGNYYEIGDLIYFELFVSWSSIGTSSGTAKITGLPRSSHLVGSPQSIGLFETDNITITTSPYYKVTQNSTEIGLFDLDGGSLTQYVATDFSVGSGSVRISGTYIAS